MGGRQLAQQDGLAGSTCNSRLRRIQAAATSHLQTEQAEGDTAGFRRQAHVLNKL